MVRGDNPQNEMMYTMPVKLPIKVIQDLDEAAIKIHGTKNNMRSTVARELIIEGLKRRKN